MLEKLDSCQMITEICFAFKEMMKRKYLNKWLTRNENNYIIKMDKKSVI